MGDTLKERMEMIVGLGNPGPEYKYSRHNIGFRVVELLTHELGVRLDGRRFQSRNARSRFEGKDIIFFCPMTYMNLSGRAVRLCADYYKIETENILVVHDDLDLPAGRIKVARQGGAGGHKGVQSIIDHFGSAKFPRVRLGIGRPRYDESIEAFVLSPFYKDERDVVEEMIQVGAEACRSAISDGVESAMNRINRQTSKDNDNKEAIE
jgi:peptidyl-tRNA hydrolase, PTH1 family